MPEHWQTCTQYGFRHIHINRTETAARAYNYTVILQTTLESFHQPSQGRAAPARSHLANVANTKIHIVTQ
jgi:hypothetical protein